MVMSLMGISLDFHDVLYIASGLHQFFSSSGITLRLQFTRVSQTSLDWFPKAILSGIRSTLAKQQITVLVYERNTKSQNLGYERITSIRLKSAKLKKKTYYHAFLGKILAFKLKYIISEHICKIIYARDASVNESKHVCTVFVTSAVSSV